MLAAEESILKTSIDRGTSSELYLCLDEIKFHTG